MRTHGTLTKWNDDRGFGFITPASGGAELFVHVSVFPRDGGRPTIGEVASYEIETGTDGKTRAVKILRPGQGGETPACVSHWTEEIRECDRGGYRRLADRRHCGVRLFAVQAIERFRTHCRGNSRNPNRIAIQMRWPNHVFANDFMRRGALLRAALPGHENGRQPRRRTLRTAVVQRRPGLIGEPRFRQSPPLGGPRGSSNAPSAPRPRARNPASSRRFPVP